MNARRHAHASRLFFVLIAMLLLTAGQLDGGSAQTDRSQIANGYLGAIQSGSPLALVSPHAVLFTPEGTFAGQDSLGRFGETLDASFDNVSFATNSTLSVGEYLMIEFTFTGIHTGDYVGATAECAGVSVPGVAVVHVGLSGIDQQWISYDQGAVLDQIEAYSQLDSSTRPTCESQGFVASEPAYNPIWAPGCLAANRCNEPY
jgi:hypothetical protein